MRTIKRNIRTVRALTLAGAIGLAWGGATAARATAWTGVKNSSFKTIENWDFAPTFDGSNDGDLVVQNGNDHPLCYTEKEGATTFTGQFMVGANNDEHTAGALNVSGGKLTINAGTYESIIGQTAAGTVTVSGGALELGGKDAWVANEGSATGKLVVTGGAVTVSQNLVLGRMDGTAEVDVNGGTVTVAGAAGTTFDGGGNAKKVVFGPGAGTFAQTGSDKLTFNSSDDAWHTYVNFAAGSGGKLSLHGVTTREYFDKLVKDGRIKIDDRAVADPSKKFQFTVEGEQGVYSLAK